MSSTTSTIGLTISVLALSCLSSLGCVTPTLYMSCGEMGLETASDPGSGIHTEFFSVLPPSSGDWCFAQRYPRGFVLVKHPSFGMTFTSAEPPPSEVATHTFALIASAFPWSEEAQGPDDLKRIVREATEKGIREADPRFTLKSLSFYEDASRPRRCVRARSVTEERDNKQVPRELRDGVLVIVNEVRICVHPADEKLLVRLIVSERWLQDRKFLAERSPAILAEASASVDSLEFEGHDRQIPRR